MLSMLFFCSGATSLGYEVIWFKRFANVWGSSALAMAVVVASVLVGLGVGAFIVGRRVEKITNPIRWYGWCEVGIGVLALIIPLETGLLGNLNAWITSMCGQSAFTLSLARGLLTLLVVGPPCLLMGGTLPLLVKHSTPENDHAGSYSAWLYGINTAGAATGCLLAGFLVIPTFGLFWTNIIMVGLNLIIAAIAFSMAAKSPAIAPGVPPVQTKPVPKAEPTAKEPRRLFILMAVALAGFASLGLQMIWARQLAVMLGGSTYAFSASLFVFLSGVGLGALLYRVVQPRFSNPLQLAAITIAILIIATVAGKMALPTTTGLVAMLKPLRASHALNTAVCAGAAMTLEFIPALMMGVLFPLFVSLCRPANAGMGQVVGSIYGWNTIGSIGGAFLTMILFVPALGIPQTLALFLALYLATLILLHLGNGDGFSGSTFAALGVGVVAAVLAARPLDPRLTDFGAFMYGYAPPADLRDAMKVLSYKEGRSCNVLVTESQNHRSLRVNGKVDASTSVDMETQLALAYLPHCLRPEARDVLVVGFGSGTTVGASLLFPETRVRAVEIEPAVVAASPFFAAVNHRPEQSSRFTAIYDDGRSFLQATDQKFDLVISEPSNPWIAGISSLFAREFYQTARKKLQPGGLFAQWVHMYALEATDYQMIVRTFLSAFPHASLIWINDKNTILVGSDQPILPPAATLKRSQQLIEGLPPVKADLEKYFQARSLPALLLSRYLLDEAGLQQFVNAEKSGQLHTDVNLRLEFDAPRRLFAGPIDADKSPARAVLEAAGNNSAIAKLLQTEGSSPDLLLALKYQTAIFNKSSFSKHVTKFAQLGLSLSPRDSFFLAQMLHPNAEPLNDTAFAELAARLAEVSPDEAAKVGGGLWQKQKYSAAAKIFEALTKNHPNSATAWMNLAMNLRPLGKMAEAEAARKRAMQLDPMIGLLRSSMSAMETQAQKSGSSAARDSLLPSTSIEDKTE